MIFKETKLKGAYIIELECLEDERGFFARSFCINEFKKHSIDFNIVQCNISFNKNKGTLRGMHFQIDPYAEDKIVSCMKGKIYDVIIDLRPDSPTYCQWFALELTAPCSLLPAHCSLLPAHYNLLYIPEGFAHGFQTLEDDTVVFYQMSEFYHPECARGVRWDDPAFQIEWPIYDKIMSEKDMCYNYWKNNSKH